MEVIQWVFYGYALLTLAVSGVLWAMGHGNEALGGGALVAGSALAGILVTLRRRNTDHKGDGHSQ